MSVDCAGSKVQLSSYIITGSRNIIISFFRYGQYFYVVFVCSSEWCIWFALSQTWRDGAWQDTGHCDATLASCSLSRPRTQPDTGELTGCWNYESLVWSRWLMMRIFVRDLRLLEMEMLWCLTAWVKYVKQYGLCEQFYYFYMKWAHYTLNSLSFLMISSSRDEVSDHICCVWLEVQESFFLYIFNVIM